MPLSDYYCTVTLPTLASSSAQLAHTAPAPRSPQYLDLTSLAPDWAHPPPSTAWPALVHPAPPRRSHHPTSSIDSTVSHATSSTSDSSLDSWHSQRQRDDDQQQWDESVRQLQLIFNVVALPYAAKWLGRRWAYTSQSDSSPIALPLPTWPLLRAAATDVAWSWRDSVRTVSAAWAAELHVLARIARGPCARVVDEAVGAFIVNGGQGPGGIGSGEWDWRVGLESVKDTLQE